MGVSFRLLAKRTGLILLGVAAGIVAGRYGPAVVSYAFIPPSHGTYRYYRNFDNRGLPYWNYWAVEEGCLVSQDFRQSYFQENWEIVRGDSSRLFLYDHRDEHDGEVIFTRTEMIVRTLAGDERHYPRVLDLWEIWHEKYGNFAGTNGPGSYRRLAPQRAAHEALISSRMKQQGLTVSPAAEAQRRPPRPQTVPVENPAQPKPVFAVTEYGAWNSTGTIFALYADGTAIARSPVDRGHPEYSYHWVDPKEAARLAAELVPPDLPNLAEHYDLSHATDQVITTLWISGKRIEIYGPWRKPDLLPENEDDAFNSNIRATNEAKRQAWATLPDSLRQTLRKIDRLRQAPGREWLPAKIEVVFDEYEHAADESLVWPKEWPGLYAATSRKRSDSYNVFVPSSEWTKLQTFLAARPPRGAVMIDLNKMAPEVRFPFPDEAAWMKQPQSSEGF